MLGIITGCLRISKEAWILLGCCGMLKRCSEMLWDSWEFWGMLRDYHGCSGLSNDS